MLAVACLHAVFSTYSGGPILRSLSLMYEGPWSLLDIGQHWVVACASAGCSLTVASWEWSW